MKLLQCTTPTRGSRSDARRDHLLETARRLFADHGFHSTGMAQIAEESGIRVGQIYRDFSSKEDIVAALAERDLALFLDEDWLAGAVATRDTACVRRWLAHFFTHENPREHDLMPEILAEALRNPRIDELQRTIESRVRATVVRAMEALSPDAEIAAREAMVDLILAMGLGLHYRRLREPRDVTDPLAARMHALVERELARLTESTAD